MKIDRPRPDRVTTDDRHESLPQAVEKRSEHEDRDPVETRVADRHTAVGDRRRIDRDGRAVDRDLRADGAQDVGGDIHIPDVPLSLR